MKHTHKIIFHDKERKPIKITEDQQKKLWAAINNVKFIDINGDMIAVSGISFIEKIKEEQLKLEERIHRPITKDVLSKYKQGISKKFAWK